LYPILAVNSYLGISCLKSQIQDLAAKPSPGSSETTEQFYVKYVDDQGDHLMVDDELNVIGIVDWQMAG
jgi:hypothetical protein